MRLAGLASGSGGNAWVFLNGTHAILVDCGLSYKQLRKRFDSIDVNPYDVSACLLTHSHGDHHQSIRQFVKKHGPLIFCTAGTFQGIPWLSERPDLVSILDLRSDIEVDSFRVKAFPCIHDAPGCVSYAISAGGHKVVTILETGRITAEMAREAVDADAVLIEANHDPQMVADSVNEGKIPQSVGLSILSRHLPNAEAARFLARAPLPKCRLAVLCHLSSDRNTPELALRTVRDALAEAGREMEVLVASQDAPTPLVDLANLRVRAKGGDPVFVGYPLGEPAVAVGEVAAGDSDRW